MSNKTHLGPNHIRKNLSRVPSNAATFMNVDIADAGGRRTHAQEEIEVEYPAQERAKKVTIHHATDARSITDAAYKAGEAALDHIIDHAPTKTVEKVLTLLKVVKNGLMAIDSSSQLQSREENLLRHAAEEGLGKTELTLVNDFIRAYRPAVEEELGISNPAKLR